MAGSHRSPVLRDEWTVAQGPRDNSGRARDRFSEHERGRNRHRGKRRPNGPGRRSRSPVSSSRIGTPSRHEGSVGLRESSPRNSIPSREADYNHRRPSYSSTQSLPPNRDVLQHQDTGDTLPPNPRRRGDTTVDIFAHGRSSRSPRPPRRERHRKNRNTGPHGRGQPSQRGKPPKRERYHERNQRDNQFEIGEPGNAGPHRNTGEPQYHNNPRSLSPTRYDSQQDPTSQRSISPVSAYEDRAERFESPHPPEPRHSRTSPSTLPHEEGLGSHRDTTHRSTTDPRKSPSLPLSTHLDKRQYMSSQIVAPNSPYYGPAGADTPDPSDKGGRNRQADNSAQHGSHSPRFTENKYTSEGPPQGPYYRSQNQNSSNMPAAYPSTPQRGGFHRGGHQDRRFSSHGPPGFNGSGSHRGRGHFNNLQWVASGPRSREGQHDSPSYHSRSGSNTPQYHNFRTNDEQLPESHHDEISRFPDDLHMEDSLPKQDTDDRDIQKTPPTAREENASMTSAKEGSKFSFAFKSKAIPAPATKPVPDLAQGMLIREPPRGPAMSSRAPEPSPRNRLSGPPPPKYKQDYRMDRRDRDRDMTRGRGRDDRREFHSRNPRETRREDHRFDARDGRRRDDHRPEFRHERRRDRSPEPKRQKRIIKRLKPRPILAEEFRNSDSVYYRKPGDESVIGAGTYGKVFKAIHIYTQDKVALKRIRMEGEKDGFPVTAMREIKLLQHLRHENIVSLLEVMVEKNECFMVFEYLSHDLTGLINHPTFTLTDPHKKDLAKQMFGGLQYLHQRGVLHRDIKAANILISNRGQLKYADFGLARFFSKSRQLDYTNRVITIWYRPPELLLGDTRYGPAVDVWSAGCVFMEMFTKKAVFPGDGRELSQLEKLYSTLGTPTRAEWPGIVEMPWVELMGPTERKRRVFEDTYRDFLSPGALDLMCWIFQYDPAKRPTADEVLAHAYFTAEEPAARQATELENIEGDWHEFESKALRKEKDKEARKDREREREREREKEKEKRRASTGPPQEVERDPKRQRQEGDSAREHG